MILPPGGLYYCSYQNYHKDPAPLLFVLYSDMFKIHGLNVRYLHVDEYKRLVKFFNRLKDDKRLNDLFKTDKREFYYKYLKVYFKDFIDVSYRTYHTMWMNGMVAHPVMLSQIGSKFKDRDKDLRQGLETDIAYKYLRKQFQKSSGTLASVKDMVDRIRTLIPKRRKR